MGLWIQSWKGGFREVSLMGIGFLIFLGSFPDRSLLDFRSIVLKKVYIRRIFAISYCGPCHSLLGSC